MAITFGMNQLEIGHPLTIFLNDRGVLVGSKKMHMKYHEQQELLNQVMANGGKVFICPMCMKKYKVAEKDLLPGLQISNADLINESLFQDGTKTMSW